MTADVQFLGTGWAFPLRTDATGSIALVTREREVQESIRIILGTAPGERPMRPEFGCAIHDLVFAPADATTAGALAFPTSVLCPPPHAVHSSRCILTSSLPFVRRRHFGLLPFTQG